MPITPMPPKNSKISPKPTKSSQILRNELSTTSMARRASNKAE